VQPLISNHAAAAIGPSGVARIREFWLYPHGWDSGKGNPLSPLSVALFEMFIGAYSDFSATPSVFLTLEGNLALAWEDHADARIEVELSPSALELFFAFSDEEFVFASGEEGMHALVARIRQHEAHEA
jgi:hypothetical protein